MAAWVPLVGTRDGDPMGVLKRWIGQLQLILGMFYKGSGADLFRFEMDLTQNNLKQVGNSPKQLESSRNTLQQAQHNPKQFGTTLVDHPDDPLRRSWDDSGSILGPPGGRVRTALIVRT